jgi:transposase-like protein
MSLRHQHCPECNSENFKPHCHYTVKSGESRTLFGCQGCGNYFSETNNTPPAGLKTPVSRISLVLEALNDGLGLNAVCRTFQVGKNTVKRWVKRLGSLKETLLLYALCHQFSQLQIEGDELYTKVAENKPAPLSAGWTGVLMNRASRFNWDLMKSSWVHYLSDDIKKASRLRLAFDYTVINSAMLISGALSFNRHANGTPPLCPRAVVVDHLVVAEQIG